MSQPDFADPNTPVGTDQSAPPEASTSPETPPESPQEPGVSADNPAWSPIFEKLPDEFHNLLKPEFQKWDQNYRSLEAERNEYRDRFADFDDIPKENLAAAYQLYTLVDTPDGQRQIYEALQKHLGLTPAEAKEAVQEVKRQQEEADPGDEPWAPKYSELQSQFDGLKTIYENQEHERKVKEQGDIIDGRVQDLLQEDPDLDTIDLLSRADAMFAKGVRGDVIGKAHKEMQQAAQRLYDHWTKQQQQTRSGPITMSPTGSAPGSGIDPETRDEEARKQAAEARFRALAEG